MWAGERRGSLKGAREREGRVQAGSRSSVESGDKVRSPAIFL